MKLSPSVLYITAAVPVIAPVYLMCPAGHPQHCVHLFILPPPVPVWNRPRSPAGAVAAGLEVLGTRPHPPVRLAPHTVPIPFVLVALDAVAIINPSHSPPLPLRIVPVLVDGHIQGLTLCSGATPPSTVSVAHSTHLVNGYVLAIYAKVLVVGLIQVAVLLLVGPRVAMRLVPLNMRILALLVAVRPVALFLMGSAADSLGGLVSWYLLP